MKGQRIWRLGLVGLMIILLVFAVGAAPREQSTPPADPMLALLIVLYGFAVSWIEERFGSFQDLSPSVKQVVNGLLGFFAPLVAAGVVALLGRWPEQIGTAEGLAQAVLYLAAPVAVWLVTQIAHYVDLWLKRQATG